MIEINGNNTQLATMDEVRLYCANQTDFLKLRLRRKENQDYTVKADTDAFTNWKVVLGVVFKNIEPEGYGERIGICENDELVKVRAYLNLIIRSPLLLSLIHI